MKHELDDILRTVKSGSARVADAHVSDAFVAGVHRKVAWRRQQRRLVASSGAVLALVGAVWGVSALMPSASRPNSPLAVNHASESNGGQVAPTLTREEIERELAEITQAARAMNYQLQRLAKVERMRLPARSITKEALRPKRATITTDPMVQAALAAETAAQSMFYRGELLEKNSNTLAQARSAYQRVIEVFPHTAAADRARQRLQGVQDS